MSLLGENVTKVLQPGSSTFAAVLQHAGQGAYARCQELLGVCLSLPVAPCGLNGTHSLECRGSRLLQTSIQTHPCTPQQKPQRRLEGACSK